MLLIQKYLPPPKFWYSLQPINDDDVQKTISTVTASELPHSGKDTATLVKKKNELLESIRKQYIQQRKRVAQQRKRANRKKPPEKLNTSISCVSIDNTSLPEKTLPYAIVPVTETFDVLAIQSELLARDIDRAKVLIKKGKKWIIRKRFYAN